MSWNLFLDDERFPPQDGREWKIARSYKEAKELIQMYGYPSFVSFDHDLGEDVPTGYDFVKHLCTMDLRSSNKMPDNFDFYVHSQNPVGKKNIEEYMNFYFNFKEKYNNDFR